MLSDVALQLQKNRKWQLQRLHQPSYGTPGIRDGREEEAAEWVTPEVRLSFPDAQEFDTGVVQQCPATQQVF